MGKRSVLILASFLALAGCVQQTQPLTTPSFVATTQNDAEAPTLIAPAERPTVSTVHLHEEVDPKYADFGFTQGGETLEPRDVAVDFQGIHPVLDEFARPVDAYVFRYDARFFEIDDFSGSDDTGFTGHYVTQTIEYAFSAADASLVGVTNLATSSRMFVPPESHIFVTGSHAFAFVFLLATDGNLSRELEVYSTDEHSYYMHYEMSDLHPLPGECQSYSPQYRVDPPLPPAADYSPEAPVSAENQTHSLICVQPGEVVPLWAWHGSAAGGSARTTRLDSSFALPPTKGERLPPHAYDMAAWGEVAANLPGQSAIRVPPTSKPGDWADLITQRVRALELDPHFLQFRAEATDPTLAMVWMGIPSGSGITLPGIQLPVTPDPLVLDSLLQISATDTEYFNVLYRTEELPVLGQMLMPQPTAGLGSSSSFGKVNATAMPAAGALQDQLAPALPGEGMTFFWSFAIEGYGDIGYWIVQKPCDEAGGAYAMVDAFEGYLLSAAQYGPESSICQEEVGQALAMPAAPHPSDLEARMTATSWRPQFP